MKENELYKRYVLWNIEKFCDVDSLDQIEAITFGDLEYWCDFRIDYLNWNWNVYNYERNVKPYMDKKFNTNCNSYVKWWKVYDCICWECF